MNYLSVLTRFGLSEKEGKIYLDLLENGNSRVSSIANRLSLHRVEIYRIIPGLLSKGLVLRLITGKTTTYMAANPEKLEKLLEDMREGFMGVLPGLQQKYSQKKSKDAIQVYSGSDAIEKLYSDIGNELPKGGIYYRYTSRSDEHRMKGNVFMEYRKLRKEKQLRRLVIISESGSKLKSQDPNRGIAVVPARFDAFDDNFQKIIFNDKVAIVDMPGNRAYVIENAELARFETKLFKFMYRFLKEYEK